MSAGDSTAIGGGDDSSEISDDRSTAESVSESAQSKGLRIAVAESLTGGLLSQRLSAAKNSSKWYRGAVVSYSSDVKHQLLKVPEGPVVSEAAAISMARTVCELMDADMSVSTTGVGGPDRQDGQPPGTVWMALHERRSGPGADDGTTNARLFHFEGTPTQVIDQVCNTALDWLHSAMTAAMADHSDPDGDASRS